MTAGSADTFDRDLQGFKHFRSLRKLLFRLHEVGTKRDTAGNRQLHMDQYCVLVLLWLFNPAIRTLRGLQRAVEFDKVRKRLGVDRMSLGSLSESVRIFDPSALAHIATELSLKLPAASSRRFDAVQQQLTAVDGSVVNTIVRVARLSWTPKAKGAKDSPVNGTSATMSIGISEPMGGWRGWCRVFRRLISCCRNGFPPPWGGEFLASAQTVSQSATPGLRCRASGTDQRLWMSITGSSSGDT